MSMLDEKRVSDEKPASQVSDAAKHHRVDW
jgi:hypothetical protein